MALTDLTGTTWVLNDTFVVSPNGWRFGNYDGNISTFSLNFISASDIPQETHNYTNLKFSDADDMGYGYFAYSSNSLYFEVWRTSEGWVLQEFKVISITGGTDATNATLIAWFEANGKQQTEPTSYTITANITNGTVVHLESEIVPGKSAVLEFKANEGYVLPKTVTVTGASHIWLENDGFLTIYDPTDNVIVNVVCVEKPRKSVDLTTLAGWSALSDGSHSITIVAKADGYRDSEPSAAVSVEKASAVTLISFTIAGTTYQAEEGMTWGEWVNSSYNTSGYYVRQDGAITNNIYFVSTPAGHVSSTDTIVSDYSYEGSGAGGGGGK